jgi:hypothetical protein
LAGKPEGKIPLGRSGSRWEDIVKMDVKEIGGSSMECIDLDQGRDKCWVHVNAVMKILVL